jgi:hypothetical protein
MSDSQVREKQTKTVRMDKGVSTTVSVKKFVGKGSLYACYDIEVACSNRNNTCYY